MSHSPRDDGFADHLEEVADLLRNERPMLDPLALDALKLRAMHRARRSTQSPRGRLFMRSRLTTLLTIAFLSLGTGGALALTDGADLGLGGGHHGSASFSQYRGHEGEPPGHSGELPPGLGGPPRGLGEEHRHH